MSDELVHCPYCPDQGWYGVEKVVRKFKYDPNTDDYELVQEMDGEQVQCMFCWTTPNSYFSATLEPDPSKLKGEK